MQKYNLHSSGIQSMESAGFAKFLITSEALGLQSPHK